ncbi:MAG: hypothetical protein HYV09_19710 [Deltaproteobacteria bacterium]|nr:hypothetical protein [Deltaproteobacteria bacterium]
MSAFGEQIARLEALLARIQRRAAEPRSPRFVAPEPAAAASERAFVPEKPTEPTPPFTPVLHLPAVAEERLAPEPIAAAPVAEVQQPIEVPHVPEGPHLAEAAHVPEVPHVAEPATPENLESISGEFAVAAVPLELEELGPADEIEAGETVIEINVEEPAHVEPSALSPVVEEGRAAPGRELVAPPHESARLAVAAPSVPDMSSFELAEERPAPPESTRNLRAAPTAPSTSDIVELAPLPPKVEALRAGAVLAEVEHEPEVERVREPEPEPEPVREPEPEVVPEVVREPVREGVPEREAAAAAMEVLPSPIEEERAPIEVAPYLEVTAQPIEAPPQPIEAPPQPIEVPPQPIEIRPEPVEVPEAPPAPEQIAMAVALAAPGAHARRIEHVAVSIEADVLRPEITPREVAAFVTAARTPRPETFGVLLDAALDL